MDGKILFISKQRLIGRRNGSSVYLIDLANAARQASFTPYLLQPSPNIMGRWPVIYLRQEMKCFEKHEIRGVIKLGRMIISKDINIYADFIKEIFYILMEKLPINSNIRKNNPRPYSISEKWSEVDHNFIKNRFNSYDIVIADYAFQAEAFIHFPNVPSAIIMHDLFHLRSIGSEGRDSVTQIDEATEIAMLSKADAVVAIQAQELEFVKTNIPHVKALLTPIGIEAASRHYPGDHEKILFVGSNTAPNVLGLKWLFNEVWPHFHQNSPNSVLNIVGSVSLAFPEGGPSGVKFHGHVANIEHFYLTCGIVISPLTFGSGLKIKLIEALSYGKAIVATNITLQGVEGECSGSVLIANTPNEFIKSMLSLSSYDTRDQLARSALYTAKTHFSPKNSYAAFKAWLYENKTHRKLGSI